MKYEPSVKCTGKGYVTLGDMAMLFWFWSLLLIIPLLLFGTATKRNTYALPTIAVLSGVVWGFKSKTFDRLLDKTNRK